MPGVDVVLPILLEVASRAHREPFRLAEGDVLIRAGSRPVGPQARPSPPQPDAPASAVLSPIRPRISLGCSSSG